MSIQETIYEKLRLHVNPDHLEVINESHLHSVPKGSESHFRIIVVSNIFENLSLLKRHRKIQDILNCEISMIRAVSLHTLTQQEWEVRKNELSRSPACAHGPQA